MNKSVSRSSQQPQKLFLQQRITRQGLPGFLTIHPDHPAYVPPRHCKISCCRNGISTRMKTGGVKTLLQERTLSAIVLIRQ